MIKYHTFGNQGPFGLFIKLTLISFNLKKKKLGREKAKTPGFALLTKPPSWLTGGGGGLCGSNGTGVPWHLS